MFSFIGFIVAVVALIDLGLGQVNVEVSPGDRRYLRTGDSLQLICRTNQLLSLILEGEVSWYFKSNDANTPEVKLTRTGKLMADSTKYALQFDSSGFLTSKLKILSATAMNTGDYICSVETWNRAHQRTVQVIVVKDVEHVELKIDEKPPVIGEEINPYEAEFHKHKTSIECKASGSYPEATIRLFVGEEEIGPESGINQRIGNAFMSSIVAKITLYPKHTGKRLRCVATVNLPADSLIEFPAKVSSIQLHIISYYTTETPVHETDTNPIEVAPSTSPTPTDKKQRMASLSLNDEWMREDISLIKLKRREVELKIKLLEHNLKQFEE